MNFKSKTEVKKAFFEALETALSPVAVMDPVKRSEKINLGNKASEMVFKGSFPSNEVFVVNEKTAGEIKSKFPAGELAGLMSKYKEAFEMAIGEVRETNQMIKDRIMKEGQEAVNQIFGPEINKIVFE